jgi:16S rRNA G1207 methylase RsmC
VSTDEYRELSELPPLPSEQLLIDALPTIVAALPATESALVVSPGRAQTADRLLSQFGFAKVSAWFLDLHAAGAANQCCIDGVEVQCGSDLEEAELDLVAIPVLRRGEAELTRELIQQAQEHLRLGGYLAVSVDNPKDQWLHDQMREQFDKVTCERTAKGSVYWARKSGQLKKKRDFSCQFVFRDEDQRFIQVVSRPGVFSHRRLDPGARQLINSAEIGPEDQVLEMGCGAGAVSLAAAFQTSGNVYAVDSNARAVQCTERGAQLNQLANLQCILNADGQLELPTAIDLALANPPYFGNDRISQHFVDTCVAALRPGGALLVVTKQPSWYEEYFEPLLEDVLVFEASKYFIACGRKP